MKERLHNIITTLTTHALHPQFSLPNLHRQTKPLSVKCKSKYNPPSELHHATSLSKSGHLSRAHDLLLTLPHTDIIAWNALLSGYAKTGQTHSAFQLFNYLQIHGPTPDIFTFSSLIKSCKSSLQNEIAHSTTLKTGFVSSAFVISGLIDNYSKAGCLNSAEKCFNECLVLDTVVWTTMISGFVRNEEFEMGKAIFREMRDLGVGLNQFSLSSVLGAIDDYGDLKDGKMIHALGIKMGFCSGFWTALSNAVMSMYCRSGCILDGYNVFNEIVEPDVVSWTLLVGTCEGEETLELFVFMNEKEVEMNEYTMINVISAVVNPRMVKAGKMIHARCYRAGYLFVISVNNALISMYGRCWQSDGASQVFDEMVSRDCVSWNAIIGVYSENGLNGLAMEMFYRMRQSSVEPNKFTLASILEATCGSAALMQAMQTHAHIIKSGFAFDDSLATGLITVYGKCDRIAESKQVFYEVATMDSVYTNAMAAAFVQAGYPVDSLKLFANAKYLDVEVNYVTFSLALKACSGLTALEQGRNIHSLALKSGFDQDNFVGCAIVDFYCKCGSVDEAIKAFSELPKYNLAAWNAMITGYAQHGYYDEVLDLFKKMPEAGVDPDEITFLGVLNSCCHTGRVKEAHDLLNAMPEDYNVMPQLEHYACVIDLLGRAGLLEVAKKTIDQMPTKPDAQIWQIVLAACNIHGNVELGIVAAKELLELQPENDAAYVLLSNLYASVGMWDEVGRMRKAMKDKAVSKEPGCSWIQVRGTMHSFFARDRSHSQIEEIYLTLEVLNNQMIAEQFSEDGV